MKYSNTVRDTEILESSPLSFEMTAPVHHLSCLCVSLSCLILELLSVPLNHYTRLSSLYLTPVSYLLFLFQISSQPTPYTYYLHVLPVLNTHIIFYVIWHCICPIVFKIFVAHLSAFYSDPTLIYNVFLLPVVFVSLCTTL